MKPTASNHSKALEKGAGDMKTKKNPFLLLFLLSMTSVFPGTTLKAETGPEGLDDEPILVGRISHIEGGLLRYQPADEGWTPTVDDTPFGPGESLYTEENSRAEIILPNGTWARFDGGTQVQLLEIRDDLTDLDLSSGTGRFYNQGAYPLIKVRTIFGDLTAQGDTAFDLHLRGNAVEVIALKGSVSFSKRGTDQGFEVTAGLGSIVADAHTVSVGKGYEPPGWASWNRERDALWAARMTSGEVSAAYLPPSLRHEAHALDENGVWEKAYYDNGDYYFWRPTCVPAEWSPFTVGCWNTWHHENTWVPYEPFGYVTHHYGNWVFIGHSWYWAPPVARVRPHVGRPLFNIGLAWYPGRVAWLSFGTNIGWVPLAPHEPYYAHRRWGHNAVAAGDVNLTALKVNVTHYKNHRHAVVIDHKDLRRARNYMKVRITNFDRASVVRNYRVAPTLDRMATMPFADTRDARDLAGAVPKLKPSFMFSEKKGHERFERVPGVNLRTIKIGQTRSNERPPSAKQRPQVPQRNSGFSTPDSNRQIFTKFSAPKQLQQTRVRTSSQTVKSDNDPKASLGTGRRQPSSRGSMGGNNRGFLRN